MTIANVDRALAIIEALAASPDGVPLVVLAASLGLPKSATHRLLESLSTRGYVVQDAVTQRYRLSMKLATIGFRLLDARVVADVVQPVLDRLARSVGEYCRVAVVESDTLHWVARAQGARHGLRYDPPMELEVALHATASGKAWLATFAEDEALRLALRRGLRGSPRHGARAVRSADDLRRQLRETRRRGYGMAIDEAETGIVAIAAVFRASTAPDAPAAGTVSMAGPSTRLDAKRAMSLAPQVLAAARELTELWPVRQRQTSQRDLADAA